MNDSMVCARGELLNAESIATTRHAQTAINAWMREYNHVRPHQALGMRPPVPETLVENSIFSGAVFPVIIPETS